MFDRLPNPAEPGFSAAMPVQSITVDYPQRQTPIFGLDLPWWATFFATSMLVALLVRRTLRVEFYRNLTGNKLSTPRLLFHDRFCGLFISSRGAFYQPAGGPRSV